MIQSPHPISRYLLFMLTLCCVQFSTAQSILGFPTILENTPSMAGVQATHDTLRWDDFVNYQDHALYGPIGKAVGQLVVSYEGVDIPFPCTATLIAENTLLTNYHCVYPSKKDAYGDAHRITSAKIYMDYNQADSGRGGLRSFAVSTIPIDYGEEPDFAILSTIDTIPFETYGLKNIKIGNYRNSNNLFLIHHSSENLASDHKRLTNRDCVAMDFSRIGATQIALPDGETGRAAIAGHDVPHFCDTKGGASGSLIFNSRGEIVGLNFAGLRNYDYRAKRFRPEDSRFNIFVDIQALLQASDTLSEILFGIEKQGNLSIDSSPSGATVLLDGKAIGTTPLRNVAYGIGDYQLRLSYNGYETHSENISITAGQHVQRSITLRANQPELIRTADELVRRARQGGTLRLAAGTFRLNSTLELSGDVRLIGQGYEQTRIVSSAGEHVVLYTGGGTFAAQGVGFEHTGNASANVVRVDNGTLDIDSCQFTKGKDDGNYTGGLGLFIRGSTRGTVQNSLFNDNDGHGIQVSENAQPRLEQNRLHDNTQVGILYAGSAGGNAVGNESYGNALSGIAVQENAQPKLEQNRLHDNTYSGIAYGGSAGGSAVGNESYGNGLHGIYVGDNAQPRLEENRLHDNTEAGIGYGGSAGGSAVGNESYGNGVHGIAVADNTQPRLEQNEAYNNKSHGIQVNGNAQPRLEENRLHDNTYSGIAYFDSAGGSAVGNESHDNGSKGISVQENAQPRLEENRLHDNTQSGISYQGSAGGSAVGNESYGNGKQGIGVQDNAQPRLENNSLYNNTRYGIYITSGTNPSLYNNTTYGNRAGDIRDLR